MDWARTIAAAGILLSACASGEEIQPPMPTFGDPTTPAPTTPSTTAASSTNGGTATSTSSASNDDDPSDPSTNDGTEATSIEGTTFFTSTGAFTTGGPVEQPEEGMYSPCESAVECFGLTFCRTVAGEEGTVGFCTNTGCAGPADCEAAPAGNATPECFPADVNGEPGMVCALTCDVGEVCPAPMICHDTASGSVCA